MDKMIVPGPGGEEHAKYKQQLVGMLKAGQLVVQMLAAEEVMTMPDGGRKATFLLDTWDMVQLPLLPVLCHITLRCTPMTHQLLSCIDPSRAV